jgi:hypothetical protein
MTKKKLNVTDRLQQSRNEAADHRITRLERLVVHLWSPTPQLTPSERVQIIQEILDELKVRCL